MFKVSGGCYCENIQVQATLSRSPDDYKPRACDCDFCTKHAAGFISDPEGSLTIEIQRPDDVNRFRQGSETAEFLVCRSCGVFVATTYTFNQKLYATLNFRALNNPTQFEAPVPASPKILSVNEKTERWKKIWFPNVRL